ncbi:signal-induced proliferation-associated 1-like protein 1 isoform X1 [Patella vulgata]|uniref:signal-induced proliferation-associated 1-like protein 1 isoform X1 n=2 Tax=Patella vulgata TaxID=6465 RepID=UPI0024A9C2C7|nr:signal-induced proliferation-associated 1-like protein 1 isoform X1 [Patella vulgata]XP_055957266.1 signal-induced proliferation-associated 1-like protein 1 isoform X1 [Patella vulgata]XP_055957267.1 signal-induced proliferation-associated 1-like protein 1 isoform X1 [Patella vulgata]XP_055957268.1 signal-induced proliferation-associated 1-like protein 1 isoform X1 [Patella vulgata]
MASDGQVVKKHSDLDIIRQRAEQAAEYYHSQVQPKSSSTNNSPDMYNSNGNRIYDKTSYGSTEDALHSGLAPVSSNSFYRAKMKAGVIDMRSSMNERIGTGRSRMRMFPSQHANRPRVPNQAMETRSAMKAPPSVTEQVKMARTNRTIRNLYRSNSIEMDSMDHIDQDLPSPTNISARREYGSTSSLDLLGNSSGDFFSMLKNYENENPDQRSPAPPKLQELLQGNITRSGRSMTLTNGSAPYDKENEFNNDSPKSKTKSKHKDRKLRAKSITGEASAGILKKLRGNKQDSDVNSKPEEKSPEDNRSEERNRKKCFVHFDCQSIGVNLAEVIKTRNYSGIVKNISTGASAASVNRNSIVGDKEDPDLIAGTDDGDKKSNCMVLSCPFFRNEIGGEEERVISFTRCPAHKRSYGNYSNQQSSAADLNRHPTCCGVSILDSSPSPAGQILPPLVTHRGHVIEYVDHGCSYYRHYFYGYDHQNFFGCDDNLGPVAVTIRREKLDADERGNNLGKADYGLYHYRIICRTSELSTLRGAVLEDAVPSSSRLSSSRGVPMKEVLEYVLPEVQLSCLRQATPGAKTSEQLLKLDEQGLSTTYKIGVMYCKKGQCTEEEMYNNENGSPAFDEFMNLIGQKIRLKGFDKYRGGLDCKTDSTGTNSYYTTFNNSEIMFHVSTMLPFTSNNIQQLFRKRHIGNDIITIIFQEAGSLPFTPKTVRSQFQHVFIIVRVTNPNTENVLYSLAVTRSRDVPPFGPPIPEKPFNKSPEFVDFLLAKLINAENAAHRSEKFRSMATRTRQEYLKDLALNYVSSTPLDNSSKLSKFALGSGRKKERTKQKVVPDIFAKSAVIWNIQVEDVGSACQVESYLAIASNTIVIIEESTKDVIFTVACSSVIGWTPQIKSIKLYFNQGEYIVFKVSSGDMEEMHEIISRLTGVTQGCETAEMTLKRNGLGQLGFHIQSEGIVTDVEQYGFAWETGLRKGSRLVEICKVSTATLSHDQTVDILRSSSIVKVVVVQPLEDGAPRGFMTLNNQAQYSSLVALNTSVLLNENNQNPNEGTVNQRNSNTLPRRSRGDIKQISMRNVNNENKNNNYDYQPRQPVHNYTDSTLSSGRSSDEGRTYYNNLRQDPVDGNTRGEGQTSSGEEHHSRTGSQDSSDYSYTGVNNRQWPPRPVSNQNQLQNNGRRGDFSSADTQNAYQSSDNSSSNQSTMQRRNFNPSTAFSQSDYSYTGVPVTGNIALELLKQSQNTKYLLSKSSDLKHGRSAGDLPTSSMSLSQMSESLYNSIGTRRPYMEPKTNNKDDITQPRRKDSAPAMIRLKNPSHTRSHLDVSPHSSNNSSPRSSNKNLSGMSSEESLNARQKPGSKYKTPSNNFQEELMRLINLDISDSDLSNYSKIQNGIDRRRSRRLQRTMSDESLHSVKGVINDNIIQPAFISPIPQQIISTQREELSKEQRLSPRAMLNTASGRPRSRTTADGNTVQDSSTALDWSDLVNVASKAIGDDQFQQKPPQRNREEEPPPRPPSPQDKQLSSPGAGSGMMWRSMVSSPQEHIQELETKYLQIQKQLEQEQRKNSALESEAQNLREENIRLQEESQTAAAQLRRFTEWFFSTI